MDKGCQSSRPRVTVEICASDVASAWAAFSGGADRVELCDNLGVGGTTPSAGAIAETCRRLSIPVNVLIRPRAGDFVYSELELTVMRHDIEVAKTFGATGIVVGVLTAEGTIDRLQIAELTALASPLGLTFHKAFDQVFNPLEALDALIELGVNRVLTSGGFPTALQGVAALRALVDHARGRLAIMAGGRLDAANLVQVIRQGKVDEVHLGSAVSEMFPVAMNPRANDEPNASWQQVDAQRVAEIVALVRKLESGEINR
jgi:copper homeostasis protein